MRTIQPTEPVFLRASKNNVQSSEASVHQEFTTSSIEGTVNLGDLGELVAAILLLFAFDEAEIGLQPFHFRSSYRCS